MSLPALGTIVHTNIIQVTYLATYRFDVVYRGNFPWVPGGGYASSPSPTLNYKYENVVYAKGTGTSNWVKHDLATLSSQVGGPKAQFFWDSLTPAQKYAFGPGVVAPQGENAGPSSDRYVAPAKKTTSSSKSSSSSSKSSSVASATPTVVTKKGPTGPIKMNPPLHNYSTGTLHFDRTSVSNASRLGLITLPSTIKNISGTTYKNRWGFKFLYNPNSWGYNMSNADNLTPEQVQASDSLLYGSVGTTWSFQLYLNRIPDLKVGNQSAAHYPAGTSLADLKQVWARGTEYDLDFLFRVVNGEPKNVTGWHSTANIGFMVTQKIQLTMGKGAFATGYISGLTVQHVMMNDLMIPTFTKVDLTMTQYIQEYK